MNVIFMTCSLQNLILSPSYRVFALRSSLLSAASFGVQESAICSPACFTKCTMLPHPTSLPIIPRTQ